MKIFIALESTSVCTDKSFDISVVSKEISRYSKTFCISRALIVSYWGSFFFYLEYEVVYGVSIWNRYIREVTIFSIFFYLKYSKPIYK